MILTLPCVAYMVAALLLALSYITFRAATLADTHRSALHHASPLLVLWGALFLLTLGGLARSEVGPWAIQAPEMEDETTARVFFSPSCSACRQLVMGMSEADAKAALQAEGYEVTSEWYTTEDIEEGTAVSTDPAAGSELNSGSEVTLYVAHSRGTELVDLTREILPGANLTNDEGSFKVENIKSCTYRGDGEVLYTVEARQYEVVTMPSAWARRRCSPRSSPPSRAASCGTTTTRSPTPAPPSATRRGTASWRNRPTPCALSCCAVRSWGRATSFSRCFPRTAARSGPWPKGPGGPRAASRRAPSPFASSTPCARRAEVSTF